MGSEVVTVVKNWFHRHHMNETAIDEALEKCLLTDSEVAEGISWMKWMTLSSVG